MIRMDYDDLDNDDWGTYYLDGKPFTGVAYECYRDGQVSSEVEIVDGIADGYVREWYQSGKIQLEGYGRSSGGHAWSREWYESGILKRESISEFGVLVKETLWNE